ncbi:hypothetical protein ACFVUP_38905, partial [Streptomyces bacillaris]|uniref:hypothetical protein n=1 Tax=Streptomyces bacillaris TaxID=68179 RepID=UPI0036DE58DF
AYHAGDPIDVSVGKARAGQWVSVWVYSQPVAVGAGWIQVPADGILHLTLPKPLAKGDHKLSVQDSTNSVIGWDDLKVSNGNAVGHWVWTLIWNWLAGWLWGWQQQ